PLHGRDRGNLPSGRHHRSREIARPRNARGADRPVSHRAGGARGSARNRFEAAAPRSGRGLARGHDRITGRDQESEERRAGGGHASTRTVARSSGRRRSRNSGDRCPKTESRTPLSGTDGTKIARLNYDFLEHHQKGPAVAVSRSAIAAGPVGVASLFHHDPRNLGRTALYRKREGEAIAGGSGE